MQAELLTVSTPEPISRRRFLSLGVACSRSHLGAGTVALGPGTSRGTSRRPHRAGPDDGASAKITTQTLRRNVSVLLGSGGNIAVLPGGAQGGKSDGKLVVDSGYSTSRPQLLAALNALRLDPIGLLINTHWHPDHTDGNGWMHEAGATIFAHEKTRQRISTPQTMEAFHMTVPPSPAAALPTELFENTRTLHGNGSTLVLTHFDPAHTDTDISIRFVEADIVHLGDTWFNGIYPFIDYSTDGSIDGMIRATERSLADMTDSTIVIPGHGPVGNRNSLPRRAIC